VAASTGEHDDHVMALALAVIGMDFYPDRKLMQQAVSGARDTWAQARKTADQITGYAFLLGISQGGVPCL